MSWTDQQPEATDVLLTARLLVKNRHVLFEIDRLADGQYRATIGNLFGSREVIRAHDLDRLLRKLMTMGD